MLDVLAFRGFFRKGGERMNEQEMTTAELTALLETLANLVEATATNPADAARIIQETIPK
jgi:hypothetical protein